MTQFTQDNPYYWVTQRPSTTKDLPAGKALKETAPKNATVANLREGGWQLLDSLKYLGKEANGTFGILVLRNKTKMKTRIMPVHIISTKGGMSIEYRISGTQKEPETTLKQDFQLLGCREGEENDAQEWHEGYIVLLDRDELDQLPELYDQIIAAFA